MPAAKQPHRLGKGRSGTVYLVEENDREVARKVFGGDRLSRLVHYVFFGAPNPYEWNEDAIACAVERRKILGLFMEAWFGSKLKVAAAYGYSWKEPEKAWQLDTEFVRGRPVQLCHPLRGPESSELHALVREIMPDLQRRLLAAGFDGALWQAGKGNPVALNNFLVVSQQSPGDHHGTPSFSFIDLESGVPALAPLNLLTLFTFYLPKSVRHGRPLFDDVDLPKLRRYLAANEAMLGKELGEERYADLTQHVDRLDEHQRRWKAVPRADRGIEYQLSKSRLTAAEAEHYRQHPWAWRWREMRRGSRKILQAAVVRLPRKIKRWLARWNLRKVLVKSWRLASSIEYRAKFARDLVRSRIGFWHKRGQLTEQEQKLLLRELEQDEASSYLTDFGAHVGLKAAVQTLELTLFASLYAAGVIGAPFLAVLILADGLIYRTAYTLYRTVRLVGRWEPIPWVALMVGLIPLGGTLAFPAQMVWSAVGREHRIARFIIYDTITRIGTSIPVWGGKDTLTEHVFNRLAHRILARRSAKAATLPHAGEAVLSRR